MPLWWCKKQSSKHYKNVKPNENIDYVKNDIVNFPIQIDDHLGHKGLNEGKENSHEQEIGNSHFGTASMINGTRVTMAINVSDTHIAKESQNKSSGYNLFFTE